ncbi:glycosyl transferase family 2 [Hasllibacter halocynthiae]|uniref:Glycosyl transferase family 2 n=1 Tax=Hasllibacter halocynthiae TaxID=595589 RepID=A0A2T0X8Q7_9RHOB|nr:glycosyltransferase family 2 protein [Hasllibacter halocynthiae]PRY95309.1 glycosyl transferase family 2 [Hasllibacter halocynthiae]
MSGPRIAAVLTVRDEGARLVDWLAHARAAGVTDVLAFSNDCGDGTDRMLEALAPAGVVHVPNPGPHGNKGPQFAALKAAARHPLVRAAEWVLPMDVDEFPVVRVGGGRLPDLIGALPEAGGIALGWKIFGSGGAKALTEGPVPDLFVRAAPRIAAWPWKAAMFKGLVRRDGTWNRLGVHRPRGGRGGMVWFDTSGRRMPDGWDRLFLPFGRDNHRLAQLNHYPLGSAADYVLKAARGRAAHPGDALGMDYWAERDFDAEEDRSAEALGPARREEAARLMALPGVAALHEAALDWRRRRLRALLEEERFRALMGRLLMARPIRALRPEEAAPLLAAARRAVDAGR